MYFRSFTYTLNLGASNEEQAHIDTTAVELSFSKQGYNYVITTVCYDFLSKKELLSLNVFKRTR